MNRRKPLFDDSRMREEVAALRAEMPDANAVSAAIERTLAYAPVPKPRKPSSLAWRTVPTAVALGGVALLAVAISGRANAASLQSIAKAVQARAKRHSVTYRPNADGKLVPRLEDWVDGARNLSVETTPEGRRIVVGYDGRLLFRVEPNGEGMVDDVGDSGVPVESVDSYLRIPGARLTGVRQIDGQDLYTIDGRTVAFELFVDPATHLPLQRDVFTEDGRLIERNVYDYPTRFPEDRFRAPSGPSITDYPVLRRRLAVELAGPGQTKTLGGVAISLKAVLVGRTRLLALWTGGAEAEGPEGVRIEGFPKPLLGDRPKAFAIPSSGDPLADDDTPTVGDATLRGDGAWYADLRPNGPFTISVPVWTEDRTRPIVSRNGRRLGFHSRFVGRLGFRVADPIVAEGPDRVVWKPDNAPKTVESAE